MDAKIVMSLETEENILKDTESALLFQDNISGWQFKIKQFLRSNQETSVSQFHHSSFEQAPMPRMHINLPKINIKSFGGDPFWNSFSAAIDKNLELSDVEKMDYLNGMLTGEAVCALSGLPLTKENYRKAAELLKERFSKTQNLTNTNMESLSKIHVPSSDTENLRELYDICEANIHGLETLGIMTESYGSLLIPILLKKIPEDISHLIFRADPLADTCSSLDRLRVAIRQEIETQEKSHISSLENSTSAAIDGEVFVPTAGVLLTNAQHKQRFLNRKPKVSWPCTYRADSHCPEKCDKIISVEERRSILKCQQRRLSCLGLKHTKIECYSKGNVRGNAILQFVKRNKKIQHKPHHIK